MATEPEKYTLAEAYALLTEELPDIDVPLSWDPCEETIDLTEDSDSDYDPDYDADDDCPEFKPRAWTKKEIKTYKRFQKENKKPVH